MATPVTPKYPGIPTPTDDVAQHTRALLILKEATEIGQRLRGDPLDSFVRLRELRDLGLARTGSGGPVTPSTSDSTKFWRGDETWSDTLTGAFTALGLITGGSLAIGAGATIGTTLTVGGTAVFTATGAGTNSAIRLSANDPVLAWNETNAGTDVKNWDIVPAGGLLRFRLVNDANSVVTNWLTVARTTTTANAVRLPNDNEELTLGAGDDLRLYHDGTNSIIQNTTGLLRILGATSGEIVVNTTGALYGTALHNNSGAVTGATNQYVVSGTYTPTLTNVTNLTASTARQSQWARVGNAVTVSGTFDADPIAVAACELGISLPLASDFSTGFQCGGCAVRRNNGDAAKIDADATNNRARVRWLAQTGGDTNSDYGFTFTYEVL